MFILNKLFSSKSSKQKSNAILIYLDAELKKSMETIDMTVGSYQSENQFQSDQFIKKSHQIALKRKLNTYQKFSECLALNLDDFKCSIVIGFGNERSSIPRIPSNITLADNTKFIRSGVLLKYADNGRDGFEECKVKLHHDYLSFYKVKEKERKVSFMPLENSTVEIMDQKKNTFALRDRFKNIVFKTTSKEDMLLWMIALTEAIKIRNSQIYMNQLDQRLKKSIKGKLNNYLAKCSSLKETTRMIPLDDIGRRALRNYFKAAKVPQIDSKLLSIIQTYLFMCKCRRQKGQIYSQQIIVSIIASIRELQSDPNLPQGLGSRNLEIRNEFVKAIQEIMKYLDSKYRKDIIEKKLINQVFQNYLLEQYRQDRRIPLRSLTGSNAN